MGAAESDDWLGEEMPDLVADDAPDSVWLVVEGSSNVSGIIYWYGHSGPAGASLGVRFDNHREKAGEREYHYWDVPETVYRQIVQALSRGESFWELVRRRGYLYRQWRGDLGYHVGGDRYS